MAVLLRCWQLKKPDLRELNYWLVRGISSQVPFLIQEKIFFQTLKLVLEQVKKIN